MNKKILRLGRLAIATLITIIIIAFTLPNLKTHWHFSRIPISLATYDLYDLGVVDADSDNNLDMFTLNHSAKQSLQLGNGKGEFKEVLSDWNLDQDKKFPYLEESLSEPEFSNPGLYIYRRGKSLYIHAHQLGEQTISGTLKLSWAVNIEQQELFDVNLRQEKRAPGVETTVDFTAQNSGWLVIRSQENIIEIPHEFIIDSQVALEDIHIGIKAIQPESHNFELLWRDRHSMAWTDLNQDGQLDVFIGRGGVKGQLDLVKNHLTDELMINDNTTFANQIESSGIIKKECPTRQSAWVDFDHDDRLDLYIICGRNDDPSYSNQLWQKQVDATFIDVASELGLDFPEEGAFRWLDVDNNGELDLLISRENSIWLYLQKNKVFQGKAIVQNFTAKIFNLIVADFDLDEDLDAYAVSKYIEEPNLLLVNEGGNYQSKDPQTIGLPRTGSGASWVDYDNDGLTDFYIAPNGLYHQLPNHQFKASQLLEQQLWWTHITDARSVWLDLNNDGFRDLLSVTNPVPSLPIRIVNRVLKTNFQSDWQKLWQGKLYKNKERNNNWLELELSASGGNSQATGVKVIVNTPDGKQIQEVGSTENSYFSQGHYRLYFGLGKYEVVNLLEIIWANGQTQQIDKLSANKVWQIKQNSSPKSLT